MSGWWTLYTHIFHCAMGWWMGIWEKHQSIKQNLHHTFLQPSQGAFGKAQTIINMTCFTMMYMQYREGFFYINNCTLHHSGAVKVAFPRQKGWGGGKGRRGKGGGQWYTDNALMTMNIYKYQFYCRTDKPEEYVHLHLTINHAFIYSKHIC